MVKKTLERLYIILIFIFLYAPIVILMVLSFNKSKTRSKWGGFTLKWYQSLFENDAIMQAFYTTIILAVLASLIATVLGTAAALGMSAMGKRTKSLMMGVTNIPMLNADIVTAIALMLLFIKFSSTGLMEFGFGTVLLAHITFCLPYVVLCVMPKLAQMDQHIYEAALDLGASPIYAFFKVILPDIFPGVLTGFLMSFTMSLDDFVITHFTKGAGVDTISTKVYTEVRKGIKPEMYALSTLLFVTVLVLLLLVNHRSAKQAKKIA
jgi:spermidine/putrescine transport system permease protein